MINDKLINIPHIIDLIYPIGSIYMSVNNTSPATLFGGTWQQLKDRFLIGTGDTYSNGATGGASSINYTPAGTNKNGAVQSHTLTINEIPEHNHEVPAVGGGSSGIWGSNPTANTTGSFLTGTRGGGKGHTHNFTQPTFTGTQATLDKMPPYLAVYMWKRTA